KTRAISGIGPLWRLLPLARLSLWFLTVGCGAFRYAASRPERLSRSRIAMKHKNSHLLVGYWSRLRKTRAVPMQSEIDPRAIKRLLSYVFILDCQSPARPVYRLAGTA